MKAIYRIFVIGLITLAGAGCSTIKTNELSEEEAITLKNKSVVLSKYNELPDFPAQTAVTGQLGLFGLSTAISNGNAMILNNEIKDPAYSIAKELAGGLHLNHNVIIVETEGYSSVKSDVNNLLSGFSDYDFLLDVKTIGWTAIYLPLEGDSYRVMYFAHARLIDINTKRVVAEEVCSYNPEYPNTNDAPSYEELENGVGLKAVFAKSVEHCVNHIRSMARLHNQTRAVKINVAE